MHREMEQMAEELVCIEEVAENGSESGEKEDWENGETDEVADIIEELQSIEDVTENGRESKEEDWDKIGPPVVREDTEKPEREFGFWKNYSLIVINNYNSFKYFLGLLCSKLHSISAVLPWTFWDLRS